ncbi:MAG: TetR/AcrR family transcriptional regulator [Ruminococcus sp.]|nr:TetR/AcrR family transcriptional regulator [Ruminococcus sp.]
MSRISEELKDRRKDEIISACAELYQTFSFREITIKKIGDVISFSRTSIYNYFQTKEEIFLALLRKEYELWISDLVRIQSDNMNLTCSGFAGALAESLGKRQVMLKIMSTSLYDMETECSIGHLTDFKRVYGMSMKEIRNCLDKFFPYLTNWDKLDFIYSFFPFMFGIYPYTTLTENQRKAMQLAGVKHVNMTVYDMVYNHVIKMLS